MKLYTYCSRTAERKRDSIQSGSNGCIPATASAEKIKSSSTQTATEATPRNHLHPSNTKRPNPLLQLKRKLGLGNEYMI